MKKLKLWRQKSLNNLVKVQNNKIIVADEVISKISSLHKIKKELEDYEKDFKNQLKVAMENNGIKSVKNDRFTATFIDENTRTTFNASKAKDFIKQNGGKVSEFEEEKPVKSSVRITYKKEG